MNLISISNANTGRSPLFDEHIIIDWNSTVTTAFCRLLDTDRWFIATISYCEMLTEKKVFNIVEVNTDVVENLKTQLDDERIYAIKYKVITKQIKSYFLSHLSNVYLLYANTLDSRDYKLKKADARHVRLFDSLQLVIHSGPEQRVILRRYFPDL